MTPKDSMEQGDREILEALGIGQGVTPLRAYAILGRRILELERLHRAYHDGVVHEQRGTGGGGRPESPFTEPKVDEIQRSGLDKCECGHNRLFHNDGTYDHPPQCTVEHGGTFQSFRCDCRGFKLAPWERS